MATFGEKRADRLQNIGSLLSESSGEKTANGEIVASACLLTGLKVLTDGVNDVTISIYDNTSASGKIVDKFVVPAAERYGGAIYARPIKMHNGIYAAMSGAGGSYYVFYASAT